MICSLVIGLGCTQRPAEPPSSEPSARRGDTLVVGLGSDPGNANPLVIPYAVSFSISDLVTPGLVRRIDGFEPALASSSSWSGDRMSLTYTLRRDLAWEDGVPLTSADVAFTWSLLSDPAVASNWYGDAEHVAALEAPDPYTVRFRYTRRRNPVLQQSVTVRGVLPRHQLQGVDRATLRGHDSARAPLASGPWRIASWEPDERIVLQPNPAAPGDWRPYLDRIVFRIIPEYAVRALELERGGIDLLQDLEVADIARFKANPRLRVIRSGAGVMQYVGYNLRKPPLDDLRLRRALTLATDRDQLIDRVLTAGDEVYGRPCVGTVSPRWPGWVPPELEPLPHDPVEARRLLAEVGFDGAAPLRLTMMLQTDSSELLQIAVWLQAQWREIGVELSLERIEPTRFSERARSGDFEVLLWSFGANPVVDPSIQWRSGGPYNWMGFSDPEVDRLLDAGVHAATVEEAQTAFHEVQRRVYAAQPATFLFWRDTALAIDRRFHDTQHDTYSPLRHAEAWWVEADERRY